MTWEDRGSSRERSENLEPRTRWLHWPAVSSSGGAASADSRSPRNKKELSELGSLVEKTVVTLSRRIHATLVDLHPPGPFDPEGLHNVILGPVEVRFGDRLAVGVRLITSSEAEASDATGRRPSP